MPTITLTNFLVCGSVSGCLNTLADLMISLFTPLGILAGIYAAFLFLTSAGDPSKMTQAKNVLLWAMAGVAVVILAKSVAMVLFDVLTY